MTAEIIARALGGKKAGTGFVAKCPAHEDRSPSLSIDVSDDGKVLVFCHAGCQQRAVIDALVRDGLWSSEAAATLSAAPPIKRSRNDSQAHALSLWSSAHPAVGTPVEQYLNTRGIMLSAPPTLRFHPRLKHCSGVHLPAMIALVADAISGKPMAIHRTFLKRDGSGKADVTPNKMMLGRTRGGVVRLGEADDAIMIGEGIETCLSVMQATGLPAWAALSASGMRAIDLPDQIKTVTLLVDGDGAGERAAMSAAGRWNQGGRRVLLARAPAGMDFNDLLVAPPAQTKEIAA